ncbi:uncharacterized protein [Ptychodera flava]|uniref:uncharacterized protein n=1 Tax=Ptychodera flava TaxID=63121 RepID=UPI00396AA241
MGCAPSSARTVSLNNAPSTKSEQETEQTAVPAGKVKKENEKDKKKALEIRDLEDTESDYSLIKTDLETITTLMDFLKGLENYATVEVIDDKLRRLSFFYDPIQEEAKSKQLADFLADINYPDLYMKIQRQVHKSYDVFHWKSREDLLGLLAVYSATSVLWNTCDASAKMCKKVGEAGIVEVIIEELEKLRDYAVTPVRDQYRDMYLRSLLATTHNVIRNCHDNRGYFRDAGAVQLLQHYLGMDKILYRSYALLTLSFVVNDDENDKINTGTENVEFFMGMLQSAVESENHRSQKESPFHVTELVAGMTKLAVNDANKVKFVEQGVLPHLVKLLKPDCIIKEQRLAATALWTLAFHDDNKNKIKNEEGCVEALEKLQQSRIRNSERPVKVHCGKSEIKKSKALSRRLCQGVVT